MQERNVLHKIKWEKANWIGHILRKNCRLTNVIEEKVKGRIEVTGKLAEICKQLLDELREKREYGKLK